MPLGGKKIAVVANQTSMVGKEHLVDYLVGNGIEVKHVFAQNTVFGEKRMQEQKLKMVWIQKQG